MSGLCLSCRKGGRTMVQLICEHELCLDCAEEVKVAEGVGPLDAKFRICCPQCRKSTITLNIQNLVNKQHEKLLFVNMESSQLSQQELQQQFAADASGKISQSRLRKMSYTERRSNLYAQRRTPQLNDRGKGSNQSRANNKSRAGDNTIQVKCSVHKEALMFYCQQQFTVMCMQCMYRHMKEQKNHNVCSISDALPTISKLNVEHKQEAKRKIQDIQRNLTICKGNKSRIQQAYEIHQQLIVQEFKQLQKLVKKKQQQSKQFLQKTFKRKQEEMSSQISDLNYLKSCLKEHFQFNIDNSTSQIYFFNAFSLLKTAMAKYNLTYKQIKKQQFFCFEKFASLEDFTLLLEKFYKPKQANGRESKAATKKQETNPPSRASQKGQTLKIKQHFYEQAKKKLQKLNKMQNQHTNAGNKKKNQRQQYLQNFLIEQMAKQIDSNFSRLTPNTIMPTYRKSSASQYVDRKTIQKTLTPTRMIPSNPKAKKK